MNKISSYVIIKKELEFDGRPIYRAYFRGTTNRVRYNSGLLVKGYTHKADLLFDLCNNPMERGATK